MLKKVIVSACVVLFYLTANASAVLSDTTDDGTGIISAHGQNLPSEGMAKAFDNIITNPNKWLDFSPSYSWIQYQYASSKRSVVTEYTLRSANDFEQRDPKNWNILGSNDGGASWVTLDTRTGELFTARYQKRSFSFTNSTAYNIYRLEITLVRGGSPTPDSVQLAEIEFIGTPPEPPVPPAKATSPNPADSAAGVSITATLSWTAGSGAKSHDVYFGTVLNDVNNAERLLGDLNGNGIVDKNDMLLLAEYWLLNPAGTEPYAGVDDDNIVDFFDYALFSQDWMKSANPVFKGNQDANSFNPGTLALNTTYYWRIDEVNGPNTITGDVWSFTTQSGKAFSPSPVSGVSNVDANATLSWSAGPGATSHNVYFGTTSPGTFQTNKTGTTYNPGTLANSTTYYWRIDEVGGSGTITGDVWSFTTAGAPGDSDSLVGKIMCGYQGWFACPGDNSGRGGWVHWSSNSAYFDYTRLKIEMWPDTTEYARKYEATGFASGNNHYYVFSSYDSNTTMVHFRWMQEYGIDGVFVQRFGSDLPSKSFLNTILSNVKVAANTYGRKYAVMYDFTNYNPATLINDIKNDWTELENVYGISNDPQDNAYIKHNGKPVIAIYGIGWFGNYADMGRVATLIQWFKDKGFTILIGVNNDWRTNPDTNYQLCVSKADIIMPWNVGRYDNIPGGKIDVGPYCTSNWVPDLNWCNTNNKDYSVCIFPGFSWNNWNGDGYNLIPRQGGQFLWDQVYLAKSNGAEMIYVAMFDEVDESTAIFKVSNNPPPPSGNTRFLTLDADGYPLPTDEYLWLVGQATRGLRGEIPVNPTRPAR
jgi:hypothetical protein